MKQIIIVLILNVAMMTIVGCKMGVNAKKKVTCQDGTTANIDGSCSLVAGYSYDSCTLDRVTVQHGSSREFFNTASSDKCNDHRLSRFCNDGVLYGSASFSHSTCTLVVNNQSCTLDGVTVQHGSSRDFFDTVNSSDCNQHIEKRFCINGTLYGNAKFSNSTCSNNVIVNPGNPSNVHTYLNNSWYINENNLLHWNGTPYIPYSSIGVITSNVNNTPTINDFHFWIDEDAGNQYADPVFLNQMTSTITSSGGTYTALIQVGFNLSDFHAKDLFKPEVKNKIYNEWKKYAPALKKDGLRAIFLFNEIDVEFTWDAEYTNEEYAVVLNEYAREMKRLVGDIPVFYKTTAFYNRGDGNDNLPVVSPSVLAVKHDSVDGVGVDIYMKPGSSFANSGFAALSKILAEYKKSSMNALLWVTELGMAGNGSDESENSNNACYWDTFPPFNSNSEMRSVMDSIVAEGVTGIIYFGIDGFTPLDPPCAYLNYSNSNRWFAGFESEMKSRILECSNGSTASYCRPAVPPTNQCSIKTPQGEEIGLSCALNSCPTGEVVNGCCLGAISCSGTSGGSDEGSEEGAGSGEGSDEGTGSAENQCSVSGETGLSCDQNSCSTGEYIGGCCIGATSCSGTNSGTEEGSDEGSDTTASQCSITTPFGQERGLSCTENSCSTGEFVNGCCLGATSCSGTNSGTEEGSDEGTGPGESSDEGSGTTANQCSVSGETGLSCDQNSCSTGEYISGCCIGATSCSGTSGGTDEGSESGEGSDEGSGTTANQCSINTPYGQETGLSCTESSCSTGEFVNGCCLGATSCSGTNSGSDEGSSEGSDEGAQYNGEYPICVGVNVQDISDQVERCKQSGGASVVVLDFGKVPRCLVQVVCE